MRHYEPWIALSARMGSRDAQQANWSSGSHESEERIVIEEGWVVPESHKHASVDTEAARAQLVGAGRRDISGRLPGRCGLVADSEAVPALQEVVGYKWSLHATDQPTQMKFPMAIFLGEHLADAAVL